MDAWLVILVVIAEPQSAPLIYPADSIRHLSRSQTLLAGKNKSYSILRVVFSSYLPRTNRKSTLSIRKGPLEKFSRFAKKPKNQNRGPGLARGR